MKSQEEFVCKYDKENRKQHPLLLSKTHDIMSHEAVNYMGPAAEN